MRGRYGDRAPDILKLYEPGSDELASDLFIVYITWEWLEQQNKTGRAAVYGYVFGRTPPVAPDVQVNGISPKELGARHACEIEYVFGTLQSQPNPWERADYRISDAMASYWANFTKTGDPNGPGLENWPRYGRAEGRPMMRFEETMPVVPQEHPERYQYWEAGREAAEPPGNH